MPMPAMRDASRPRRPVSRIVVALAIAVAVLLIAACGSSGSSSSSSGGSSSGSGGGSALSAGDKAGLAKAEAFLAKYEAQPTQITSTGKITKPIPKGLTVDFITCGATPECTQEGQIVTQADTLLGWKTVVLNNDGTPASQKANFSQVVRSKANAVLYSAIPAATFASELPALRANGTFIAACCITDPVDATTGIGYGVGLASQVAPVAGGQAAFVAADSKDTASSLFVNIPDLEILNVQLKYYEDAMAGYCPTCQVAALDVALANVGNAPSTVVSYLRSHPSVKYVVASTDAITIGLSAAIKAAGLTGIKIVGQGATPTNLVYLHSGEQAADVAFPYYEELYSMVTAVAQHAAGLPVTPSVPAPEWILTPSNAPTSTQAFPLVPGYEAQYKALWGLG
jgi:ABC-type sugar transport system substrate-binding protein